jgi:hypothetical protein
MRRIITELMITVFAIGVFGCSNPEPEPDPHQLPLDKVVELSSKGEELTWEDFEEYHGVECGSGLYIVRYDIDDDYELVIGGTSSVGSPMYINLVRKDSEDESGFIDIRTEDVQEFIAEN